MHHEGFIEAITVQLPLGAVLHMDHRRLAEGSQQLVRGVRAEYQRAALGTGRTHRIAPREELMKRRVSEPGFIEVQHLGAAAQSLLDEPGVVAQPVIGRIGHHRQLDARFAPLGQGVGQHFGLDRLGAEFAERDRPDDAQFVALGA
ncbi:hypothetical protein D3C81_1498640 [compost metagenome]